MTRVTLRHALKQAVHRAQCAKETRNYPVLSQCKEFIRQMFKHRHDKNMVLFCDKVNRANNR